MRYIILWILCLGLVAPVMANNQDEVQNQYRGEPAKTETGQAAQGVATQLQQEARGEAATPSVSGGAGYELTEAINLKPESVVPVQEQLRVVNQETVKLMQQLRTEQTAGDGELQLQTHAQEQLQTMLTKQTKLQTQLQTSLNQLEGGFFLRRWIMGADGERIGELEELLSQNQQQLQQLRELHVEVRNEGELEQLRVLEQAMLDQQEALQQRIQEAQQSRGILGVLFGWMLR
jgi:hypothetical protein